METFRLAPKELAPPGAARVAQLRLQAFGPSALSLEVLEQPAAFRSEGALRLPGELEVRLRTPEAVA